MQAGSGQCAARWALGSLSCGFEILSRDWGEVSERARAEIVISPKSKAKTSDADGATGSTAQAVQAIDTAADVSAKAILDAAALTQTNPKTVQGVVEKEVNVDTEAEKRAHRKYPFVVSYSRVLIYFCIMVCCR